MTLARTAYTGDALPGRARVRVGEVVVNREHLPAMGRVFAERRVLVRNGSSQTLLIPVDETPVRVEVSVGPTFQPSESDRRQLGAQVVFRFVPDSRN